MKRYYYSIQEWEEMYREQIEEVMYLVLRVIRLKTVRSMHITKIHVNEDEMYNQLVEYMYKTSNNTHKHYCR